MSSGGSGRGGEAPKHPTRSSEARSFWLFVGVSLLLAAGVLIGLAVGVGVDLDAPTLALAAACVVMVWALRSMWNIVVALSRPVAETILVEAEAVGPIGGQRSDLTELREEKARVLRAIKELEFDHAMGKLSEEDFKQIGDRYRLRAIEVIRQLEPIDGSAELHPLLAEHLAAAGAKLPNAKVAETTGEKVAETTDEKVAETTDEKVAEATDKKAETAAETVTESASEKAAEA